MANKFGGKVAIITGGSTGMGLATAKRFVQEGMDQVFITGRRKDALDRAAGENRMRSPKRFRSWHRTKRVTSREPSFTWMAEWPRYNTQIYPR